MTKCDHSGDRTQTCVVIEPKCLTVLVIDQHAIETSNEDDESKREVT